MNENLRQMLQSKATISGQEVIELINELEKDFQRQTAKTAEAIATAITKYHVKFVEGLGAGAIPQEETIGDVPDVAVSQRISLVRSITELIKGEAAPIGRGERGIRSLGGR